MIATMPEPKTYNMMGGGSITGSTPEEIVAALWADCWNPEPTLEEFMEGMSSRCRMYDHNAIISTYNAEEFVIDLCANGFLTDADAPAENVLPFPNEPEPEK